VTELIQGYVVAMNLERPKKSLMHTIFRTRPLSEMMKEAVLDAYGRVLEYIKERPASRDIQRQSDIERPTFVTISNARWKAITIRPTRSTTSPSGKPLLVRFDSPG